MQPPRLLDQVRERIRYKHYSLRTEKAYVYWIRWFVRWSGLRHPREMGAFEVQSFLSYLAGERNVAASTHKVALSALLFLYKEVLLIDLPWLNDIGRPKTQIRIPVVLSPEEVQRILLVMENDYGLVARLLYGTGMRITETLSLRVKDVDFARHLIIVRDGKGGKDRIVMLPDTLQAPLQKQLHRSQSIWANDRAANRAGVSVPHALERKSPRIASTWAWHWVFPQTTLSIDPRTGMERRHHL